MQINVKKSNAGFSLVELLVVVAIMGLLMGITAVTWYAVSSANVNKAASYIEEAMLEGKNRAMTTSAKSWDVIITNDKVKLVKTYNDDRTEVIVSEALPSNVDIKMLQGGSAVVYDLGGENPPYDSIVISYKLLSGEVKKITASNKGAAVELLASSGINYVDIVCYYKDERSETIRLYLSTGKHIRQ